MRVLELTGEAYGQRVSKEWKGRDVGGYMKDGCGGKRQEGAGVSAAF
jgi:hypothetical protein